MEYIAQATISELSTVLGVVFAGFGAMLVGFYKYANSREKEFEKSRTAQTTAFEKALDKLGSKIEEDSKVAQKLVEESVEMRRLHAKGYAEAEARNGHLAEITVQSRDQVIDTFSKITEQNIKNQVVEHQTIKD